MEIEVGMYVRTKLGSITKIENEVSLVRYIGEIPNVRFSHNIIDLIEVGDYVNGYPVYETIEHPDNTRAIVIADDNKSIIWEESSQYIKSIVTKEQMEIMKYEVK